MKFMAISILLAVIAITSCGTVVEGDRLMGTMPAGYDIYAAVNPEGVGIIAVLNALADSPIAYDGDIDQMQEALGFDPLNWDNWVDALALDRGRDVGFIVNGESSEGDVSLVCVYVPSSNHELVQQFFTDLLAQSGEFKGELEFRETGGYSIVLIAENAGILDGFDPGSGPVLASDPDYSRLTGSNSLIAPSASVFIRFEDIMEEDDVHSMLFEMQSEGPELSLRLAAYTTDPEIVRQSDVLAASPLSSDIRIPASATSILRISLDMASLKEVSEELGIDQDMSQGIAMFGFDSFSDLLNTLSGDICLSYGASDEQYSAAIQFGLTDTEAITDLLNLISTMMTGTEGLGLTEFDIDGTTCYSAEGSVAPGIESIEFGVLNNTLMIAGGYSLTDLVNGLEFEDFASEQGMGISSNHGVVFISDIETIKDAMGFPLNSAAQANVVDETSPLSSVAGTLDINEGLFELVVILEASDGNPFSMAAEILAAMGIDMLARPVR